MKKVAKVDCEGQLFLIFEGHGAFWAVDSKFISTIYPHGFSLHAAIKRDSKEAAIQAAIDSVGINKIVDETGKNRLDALIQYYFG